MRFITGLAAAAATLALVGAAPAMAGGFGRGGGFGGGAQGYGVGAFGPGNGPVGAYGFRGNPHGPQDVFGLWGYGGYGGGYGGGGGGDNFVVPGGNATVNNYLHYDARPRDGGYYGGGGVFYGDNGYSRVYYNRPPSRYGDDYCPPAAPDYRPAQHVYYLQPYRRARHAPRY